MNTKSKKGLCYAAIAIAVFIAIICTLNLVYIARVLEKQQTFRKEAEFQGFIAGLPDKHIGTLFLGASHTEDGLDPEFIPNSFNASDSGENYIEIYYQLKKILEIDRLRVDAITLEIDTNTLSTIEASRDALITKLYYRGDFIPYRDISRITNKDLLEIWFAQHVPVIGHGREFSDALQTPELTEINKGWAASDDDFSKADRATGALQQYNYHYQGQPLINEWLLSYFLKTLELAKANNIRVNLVIFPVSSDYAALVAAHLDRAGYYGRILSETKKILGNDFKLLDFYNAYFDHPEYFSNADHLNKKGAEIFSRKIAPLLK